MSSPAHTRFPRLTYKSAALSRARPASQRLPQRSVTTLGALPPSPPPPPHERTMSLTSIPRAPLPSDNSCSRCTPAMSSPSSPTRLPSRHRRTEPRHSSRHVEPSARERRSKSSRPSFPYRALVRSRSRVPQPVVPTPLPDVRAPNRAVYNATTASARAAALSSSKGGVGFLVDARERHVRADSDFDDFAHVPPHRDTADRDRDQERDHDLDDPKTSDPASSTSDASRVTRIVVKRRVIRGSSVMRPATEADIDQFLQVERHREMVSCPATAINIPPLVTDARPMHFDDLYNADRETCSYCSSNLPAKKAMSKRGVRRVSSLLSRHLGLDGDSEHTLDVSEMAAMDEYKAVALFLREIRRYRKEMFLSVQDRPFDRPTEKSTNYTKRKEAKKGKERRYARDMERVQVIMSQRRSLSADDPALMRAILRQERLLSTHSAKRKGKVDRETSEGVTPVKSFDNVKDDYETQYALERSQSELVPKRTSKSVEGDEAWKRVVSRLGIDGLTKSVRQKTGLDDGRKSDRSVAKRLVTENEEDDDYTLNPLRILTAIEPVDPAGAFEDSDARRGTSYHVGMDEPGVAGSRRRGLHRGIGGAEPGLLRRLRSFRRREQRA